MNWINEYDMDDLANRRRVSEIADHHYELIEKGWAFDGGPMSGTDLATLAQIASACYDTDTMVRDFRHNTLAANKQVIEAVLTIVWAFGFKTGAQMYGTTPDNT